MLLPRVADPELQHELTLAAQSAEVGAAAADVLVSTAARIADDGDPDTWVLEWMATAGSAWAAGNSAAQAGEHVTAREHYLHAATYYAIARAAIGRSSDAARRLDVWRRQRACWDRAAARFDPPAVRLELPYEDTTLPAYFFRAPDASPGERRATVIVSHGGDGPTSQAWTLGGAAAAARGHHWMTFDGPGQQAALVDQGLVLRPDWEAVLTPVVDAVLARDDVDPERLALVGTGLAGYWIPRALAFEHRLAAAVADPGVVDVSARWVATLPTAIRDVLRRGDRHGFEREFRLAALFAPELAERLRLSGEPYGVDGNSPAALYDALAAFRLGDEVRRITTPLLVTDRDGTSFWPGQSQQLFDRLTGPRSLVDASSRTRDRQIFGWLDGYLG